MTAIRSSSTFSSKYYCTIKNEQPEYSSAGGVAFVRLVAALLAVKVYGRIAGIILWAHPPDPYNENSSNSFRFRLACRLRRNARRLPDLSLALVPLSNEELARHAPFQKLLPIPGEYRRVPYWLSQIHTDESPEQRSTT